MLKKNSGITLIALIITIIVLLILAGISISAITGENGTLKRAGDASEKTKDAKEDEQVKLVVSGALSDGVGELTTDNLKKAIGEEFGEDKKEKLTGEGPWTFKGERNSYTIKKNGSVEEKDSRPLAKDLLHVNLDGETDAERSPYIKYNNEIYRVFYNDESHGLQLVPFSSSVRVDLGFNDTSVEPWSFTDEEATNNAKIAVASYQNAKDTLRKTAETYLEGRSVFVDARCLGSKAKLINERFDDSDTEETVTNIMSHSGELKLGDDDYVEDFDEINELSKGSLTLKHQLWLSSRFVYGSR